MEMQYFKDYSPALGRDMECKIYGHAGRPMLYIPCQDGRFFDFENFHMADTLAPWIDAGKIMVISIDTMDKETWSDTQGDPYWRIRRYEQWLRYIVEEAVPKLQYLAKERNGWDDLPGVIAFGCSLGATHAVNLYLRRPDVFCGCLALSGIYTAHYGFGNYMDELVYMNSPVDYMKNFPEDHPYMVRATGNGRTPHGSSSASSRPRTSPSGWTCGATMSTTTGTGGISRLHITCRIFWASSKTNPLRR